MAFPTARSGLRSLVLSALERAEAGSRDDSLTQSAYDSAMTQTTLKVGSPAWYRGWGLTLDKMGQPAEYIVLRGDKELSEPVCRVAYNPNPTVLAETSGMPEGVARKLVSDVEAKRSDQGYRPIN